MLPLPFIKTPNMSSQQHNPLTPLGTRQIPLPSKTISTSISQGALFVGGGNNGTYSSDFRIGTDGGIYSPVISIEQKSNQQKVAQLRALSSEGRRQINSNSFDNKQSQLVLPINTQEGNLQSSRSIVKGTPQQQFKGVFIGQFQGQKMNNFVGVQNISIQSERGITPSSQQQVHVGIQEKGSQQDQVQFQIKSRLNELVQNMKSSEQISHKEEKINKKGDCKLVNKCANCNQTLKEKEKVISEKENMINSLLLKLEEQKKSEVKLKSKQESERNELDNKQVEYLIKIDRERNKQVLDKDQQKSAFKILELEEKIRDLSRVIEEFQKREIETALEIPDKYVNPYSDSQKSNILQEKIILQEEAKYFKKRICELQGQESEVEEEAKKLRNKVRIYQEQIEQLQGKYDARGKELIEEVYLRDKLKAEIEEVVKSLNFKLKQSESRELKWKTNYEEVVLKLKRIEDKLDETDSLKELEATVIMQNQQFNCQIIELKKEKKNILDEVQKLKKELENKQQHEAKKVQAEKNLNILKSQQDKLKNENSLLQETIDFQKELIKKLKIQLQQEKEQDVREQKGLTDKENQIDKKMIDRQANNQLALQKEQDIKIIQLENKYQKDISYHLSYQEELENQYLKKLEEKNRSIMLLEDKIIKFRKEIISKGKQESISTQSSQQEQLKLSQAMTEIQENKDKLKQQQQKINETENSLFQEQLKHQEFENTQLQEYLKHQEFEIKYLLEQKKGSDLENKFKESEEKVKELENSLLSTQLQQKEAERNLQNEQLKQEELQSSLLNQQIKEEELEKKLINAQIMQKEAESSLLIVMQEKKDLQNNLFLVQQQQKELEDSLQNAYQLQKDVENKLQENQQNLLDFENQVKQAEDQLQIVSNNLKEKSEENEILLKENLQLKQETINLMIEENSRKENDLNEFILKEEAQKEQTKVTQDTLTFLKENKDIFEILSKSRLASIELSLKEKDIELNGITKLAEQYEGEASNLKQQIEERDNEVYSLRENMNKLEQQIQILRFENLSIEEEKIREQGEKELLEIKSSQITEQYEMLLKDLDLLKLENQQLLQDLEERKYQYSEVQNTASSLHQQLTEALIQLYPEANIEEETNSRYQSPLKEFKEASEEDENQEGSKPSHYIRAHFNTGRNIQSILEIDNSDTIFSNLSRSPDTTQ